MSRTRIVSSLAMLAGLLVAYAGNGFAQTATTSAGDFYLKAAAGLSFPQSFNANLDGNQAGAARGSGKLSLKPGGRVSILFGYDINDWLAGEFEGAHSSYAFDTWSASLAAPGSVPPFFPAPQSVNGSYDVWLGFVNLVVSPFGRKGRGFSPYAGVGVGLADTSAQVNSISNTNTCCGIVFGGPSASFTTTSIATHAILGFDYGMTDQFSLGLRYSFEWINSHANAPIINGNALSLGDVMAHTLTATAAYHF